jgi:ankyrin repeat protein
MKRQFFNAIFLPVFVVAALQAQGDELAVNSATETLAPSAGNVSTPEVVEDTKAVLLDYFFSAAREGRTDMLNEFVVAGFDLNSRDNRGYSALMIAAYHGHKDIIVQLMEAGADPCAQDNSGRTALMAAVFRGEFSIARHLLNAECNPNTTNNAGQTAAMYAALFQREQILTLLQERGADLTLTDHAGNTAKDLQTGEIKTDYQP